MDALFFLPPHCFVFLSEFSVFSLCSFRSLFYKLVKTTKKLVNTKLQNLKYDFKLKEVVDSKIVGSGLKYVRVVHIWL